MVRRNRCLIPLARLGASVAHADEGAWHFPIPNTPASGPVKEAQGLLDAGEYAEGLSVLQRARLKRARDPEEQARVLAAMARFHTRYAEAFDAAERLLVQLRRLPLSPRHPERVAADKNLHMLRTEAERHSAENAALDRIDAAGDHRAGSRARVEELEALVQARPDMPRIGTAHYLLGKNLMRLGRHRASLAAFDRALALRPALGCSLPVDYARRQAFKIWAHEALSTAAWGLCGAFLLVTALLFYRRRPWTWLTLRHGAALAALAGVWWIVLLLSVRALARVTPPQTASFPQRVQLSTAFGSPASGALDALFWWGLAGVTGVYVLALALSGRKLRFSRALVCGTAGLVLSPA